MGYQREREQFILAMERAGVGYEVACGLLRDATTLQRLAEAQCNGDWPADNGQRETVACGRCEGLWAPSAVKHELCVDCRAEDRARARVVGLPGIDIETQGDPRGYVLRVIVTERVGEPYGTRLEIGVPVR